MHKISNRSRNEIFLTLSLLIWLMFWHQYTLSGILQRISYYKKVMRSSPDQIHEMHFIYDENSRDYYRILSLCNKWIPLEEKITLIFPTQQTNKDEFLRDKGRYYLYPRNYGKNEKLANYILVYDSKDFQIPDGYQKKVEFGPNKYLTVKQGYQLKNSL